MSSFDEIHPLLKLSDSDPNIIDENKEIEIDYASIFILTKDIPELFGMMLTLTSKGFDLNKEHSFEKLQPNEYWPYSKEDLELDLDLQQNYEQLLQPKQFLCLTLQPYRLILPFTSTFRSQLINSLANDFNRQYFFENDPEITDRIVIHDTGNIMSEFLSEAIEKSGRSYVRILIQQTSYSLKDFQEKIELLEKKCLVHMNEHQATIPSSLILFANIYNISRAIRTRNRIHLWTNNNQNNNLPTTTTTTTSTHNMMFMPLFNNIFLSEEQSSSLTQQPLMHGGFLFRQGNEYQLHAYPALQIILKNYIKNWKLKTSFPQFQYQWYELKELYTYLTSIEQSLGDYRIEIRVRGASFDSVYKKIQSLFIEQELYPQIPQIQPMIITSDMYLLHVKQVLLSFQALKYDLPSSSGGVKPEVNQIWSDIQNAFGIGKWISIKDLKPSVDVSQVWFKQITFENIETLTL